MIMFVVTNPKSVHHFFFFHFLLWLQADGSGEHVTGTHLSHLSGDMEPSRDRSASSRRYLLR
jgi:hypothetical protein